MAKDLNNASQVPRENYSGGEKIAAVSAAGELKLIPLDVVMGVMSAGVKVYTLKADMIAAGEPELDEEGHHKRAQVLGDTESNNGLYYWNGGWQPSPSDPLAGVVAAASAQADIDDIGQHFGNSGRADIGFVILDANNRAVMKADVSGVFQGLRAVGEFEGRHTGTFDMGSFEFSMTQRPDVALAVVDASGRGVVMVDSLGQSPEVREESVNEAGILSTPDDVVLSDSILTDIAKFGRIRGFWGIGELELNKNPEFSVFDVVFTRSSAFLCINNHIAEVGDAEPLYVGSNWEPLPTYREQFAADDNFGDVTALNGRELGRNVEWVVSGAGVDNGVINQGGWIESIDNTYFIIRNLPQILEWSAVGSHDSDNPNFTMAIGGHRETGQDWGTIMMHPNFRSDQVNITYWDYGPGGDGSVAEVLVPDVIDKNFGHSIESGQTVEVGTKVRGRISFFFVDKKISRVVVDSRIPRICGDQADRVYCQVYAGESMGSKRHYRCYVKTKAAGISYGQGSPEGVVSGWINSIHVSDGDVYVKTDGASTTNWAKLAKEVV